MSTPNPKPNNADRPRRSWDLIAIGVVGAIATWIGWRATGN